MHIWDQHKRGIPELQKSSRSDHLIKSQKICIKVKKIKMAKNTILTTGLGRTRWEESVHIKNTHVPLKFTMFQQKTLRSRYFWMDFVICLIVSVYSHHWWFNPLHTRESEANHLEFSFSGPTNFGHFMLLLKELEGE